MQTGYVNLYRSGFYHRAGKPHTFNLHPGDIYSTRSTAFADRDPRAPYVTTVRIEWEGDEIFPVNPEGSVPMWSKK